MLHTKIIDIKKEKIEVNKAEEFISSSKFGASLIFRGTVRETNENKRVKGIKNPAPPAGIYHNNYDWFVPEPLRRNEISIR